MFKDTYVYSFFQILINLYSHSVISLSIQKIRGFLFASFENSEFLICIKKDGYITRGYKESIFYKILVFSLNIPVLLYKKVFELIERFLEDSYILEVSRVLLKRFDIIIGIVICITMVVPDRLWFNVYSLIFAVMLYLVYAKRTVIFKQEAWDIRGLDFSYVLFFVLVILSTITSIDFSASARFLMFHITDFFMIVVICLVVRNESKLRTLTSFMLLGVFAISVFGIFQIITNSVPFDPALTDVETNQGMPGRVFATMANPNNFAEILTMTFPFAVAMLLSAKNLISKLYFWTVAIAILLALVFTGSRSCWLAFALSAFVMLVLKKPSAIPVVALFGIALIPLMPDFLVRRFMTLGNMSADSSTMYRLKIFETVLPMIKDYWHTGVGLGTDVFMRICSRYDILTKKVPVHTHVLYVQILLEMGILGLLAFLWTMLRNFKEAIKFFYIEKDPFVANILAAGVSSLSGMLLVSIVEYIWYYPRVMFLFWVIVGILMSAISIARNKKITSM